jgi:hypothetical protein
MEKPYRSKLNINVRNVRLLSLFREKQSKPSNSPSFSNLKILNDKYDFLEIECKILTLRTKALEKSFEELKTEFDNLSLLCARTIIKENRR